MKRCLRAPKSTFAYDNRSFVFYSIEKYSQAIADASTSIRLDPKNAYPYDIRSLAYEAIGNKKAADADRKKYEILTAAAKR